MCSISQFSCISLLAWLIASRLAKSKVSTDNVMLVKSVSQPPTKRKTSGAELAAYKQEKQNLGSTRQKRSIIGSLNCNL